MEVEDVEAKVRAKELTELRKMLWLSVPLSSVLMGYMIAGALGLSPPFWEIREWIGLILSTPVLLVGGRRFFSGAFRALRNRMANMDVLVSLGTGSAYLFSLASTVGLLESSEVYYEASAMVVTFVLLGRYLEARMKMRTGEAVKKLMEMQPRIANVLRDGKEIQVPIEEVRIKDIVVVRLGERLPVDGIVAGTTLVSGSIKVIVTRVGKETMLSQIIRLVRHAQAAKPPIQKLVDKVASVFSWAVMTVALNTFLYWYYIVGAHLNFAVLFTASTLLIACPLCPRFSRTDSHRSRGRKGR